MALFTARRLRAAAVAGVLGSLLLGAAPANAAAAPTLTSSGLAATVKGYEVTTTTTVSASSSTLVAKLGVCVRGPEKANFDFVKAQNVTVTSSGYTQTATQTLPAGSYSYWTCAYYNGAWLTLDSAKPFVVSDFQVVEPPSTTMPVGDLPGWKQVFSDDFTTNAALGTFGDVYKNKFSTYNGFADSYNGGTYNKNILSVGNGALDMYLHKENNRPQVAAPAPIVTTPWAGQTYGKFSVRFKSEALAGYKTAWLLWPDSNIWSQGEIDFPEGGLNGKMWAFNHCVGNPGQNCSWVDTQTTYTSWHTLSIEWTPARVTFLLDGQVVGNDTKNIPSNPMHWVLQTETTSANAATQDGHLQIDWMTVYTYSPGTTGTVAPTSGSTAPVSSTSGAAQIETASTWKRVS
jgi:hypothetical protein